MMGADVERMISGIESVRDATDAALISFAEATAYQLISREQHAGLGSGPCRPEEIEVPAGNPMTSVSAAMSGMGSDCGKMDTLESGLYTSSSLFNNGLGSPWNELTKLQKAVAAGEAYAGAHAPFNYVGEKAGMLALLNMILSAAVDAKNSMTIYHDYIQRGFDNQFNGNKPSIDFDGSKIGDKTTGNLKQEYEENVNIPQASIDPF